MVLVRCAALALVALLFHEQDSGAITFSDSAVSAGVADPGLNGSAAFGDYTADGWPDLLVTQTGPGEIEALIYQNAGDGRFERQFGMLAESGRALGALFVDLESDGDLDVYLVQNRRENQWFLQIDGNFELQPAAAGLADAPLPSGAVDVHRDVQVNSRIHLVEGVSRMTAIETEEDRAQGLLQFGLEPNFPNPFNAETRIRYTVPQRGRVKLAIYNALGQLVRTVVEGESEPGIHGRELEWA